MRILTGPNVTWIESSSATFYTMLSEIVISFLIYILSGSIIDGASLREQIALASHPTLAIGLLMVNFWHNLQDSSEVRLDDVAEWPDWEEREPRLQCCLIKIHTLGRFAAISAKPASIILQYSIVDTVTGKFSQQLDNHVIWKQILTVGIRASVRGSIDQVKSNGQPNDRCADRPK